MDIDAFIAVRQDDWQKLVELTRQHNLTGAEADELVRLYQAVATDLSTVRSATPDPQTVSYLSSILSRARARIGGTSEARLSDLRRFLFAVVPLALYRIRWWIVAVSAACIGLGLVSGIWLASDPSRLSVVGTESQLRMYADQAFAAYYTDYPAPSFAAQVWTNNAWIAVQCIAFGISGFWPLYVLAQNMVNVGMAGAVMYTHDGLDVFLSLILPHGMLELTGIFVAGAAGLRLFWTMVAPGPRTRSVALAEQGQAVFAVAIGLVGVLAVSGFIEGFVTGSWLPSWLQLTIGALALAAFWAYVWLVGGAAEKAGHTTTLRRQHTTTYVETAG